MPRKVKFHPSVMTDGGFPQDGDEYEDFNNAVDDDEPDEAPRRRAPDPDRLTKMEAELERLREENSLIKRAIPPAEPRTEAQTQDEIEAMSDEDFDSLLFSNPREALRLNNERVKRELRAEYTNNQGTTKFWDQFYDKHGDLKGDEDLVQSTLQKNMSDLAPMDANKAMDRLAELTRDRIMGYVKKTRSSSGRSRAVAEGANPPAPPAPAERDDDDNDRPGTMGDMLKARKERRRRAASQAA